jgi:Flp pilus assembly protein TadG
MLSARGKGRLASARRGVAAMEFGMVAPIMGILTLGVYDISKACILWEQTWDAARNIAESASTVALQPDGSTNLTPVQAQQALSVIFAEMPWLRAGVATGNKYNATIPAGTVSAVLSSVAYQPTVATCTTSCAYAATLKWSKAYSGYNFTTGTSVLRACNANGITQVAPNSAPSLATVPTLLLKAALLSNNSNQPDPFLVADVTFTYTPFLARYITGPITFRATAFWTSRSTAVGTTTPWTTYTPAVGGDAASVTCS